MLRLVLTLVVIGLTVYAVLDCLGTPAGALRTLPRPVWLAVVILFPVAGPLAWILAGKQAPAGGQGGRPVRPVVAPDDDPDFLWRLEQERRRREQEREQGRDA